MNISVKKTSIAMLVIMFNLTSCFTDVEDKIKNMKVNARDIESILSSVDLSRYASLKDTTAITLMAWRGVPDEYLSLDRIKEVKDAGFNLMYYPYKDIETMKQVLDYAEVVGIKILISCPELYTHTNAVVRLFKDHPANGGYFLQDEPTLSYIPQLSELTTKIESIDDTRFTYINLLPYYGGNSHYSNPESYHNYVQRFIAEIPLKILSFDHYPIVQDKIRLTWNHNLEIIKETVNESNIHFWSFVMSSAHYSYPIPTIGHLRLQVYSNIAYGAKGIQYFTYWMPDRDPYISGPIDRKGNKTNVYYLIQEMNKEIQNFSYIFQTTDSHKVSFFGSTPPNTKEFSILPYFINSIDIREGNALLSEMKNYSNDFFMIQNINLHNELAVKIQTDSYTSIILKNGKIIPVSLIKEEFKITPGDMVLFMR